MGASDYQARASASARYYGESDAKYGTSTERPKTGLKNQSSKQKNKGSKPNKADPDLGIKTDPSERKPRQSTSELSWREQMSSEILEMLKVSAPPVGCVRVIRPRCHMTRWQHFWIDDKYVGVTHNYRQHAAAHCLTGEYDFSQLFERTKVSESMTLVKKTLSQEDTQNLMCEILTILDIQMINANVDQDDVKDIVQDSQTESEEWADFARKNLRSVKTLSDTEHENVVKRARELAGSDVKKQSQIDQWSEQQHVRSDTAQILLANEAGKRGNVPKISQNSGFQTISYGRRDKS